MLRRFKRMYELSKKDPKALQELTDEQIAFLPDEGDGKAEWLGEGTQEEMEEQEREDKGMKNIFGIGL